MEDYLTKSMITVNLNSELIRPKTEEDPARRG